MLRGSNSFSGIKGTFLANSNGEKPRFGMFLDFGSSGGMRVR